jgi:hypothetical protein
MSKQEKIIADACNDFMRALPDRMQNKHLGSIICVLFDGYEIDHDSRIDICSGVLNVMIETDLRDDAGAAQAADDVIARAAAKARK